MKFQKGLLDENAPKPAVPAPIENRPAPAPLPVASPATPVTVDKDRLFQTVNENERSGKKYLLALAGVGLVVAIAASAAWYAMRPGVGDRVAAPRGLDLAVRDHFLEKEKRTATDIAFYLCDGFYWARVGVETRTDLPNPLFRVDTYAASARQTGEIWSITARPAAEPQQQVPCS